MTRPGTLALGLALLAAGACTDQSPGLFVELKTDLRPGVDFALARVKVFDGPIGATDTPLRETRASVGMVDAVLEGHRVADIEGLDAGTYYVELTLLDDAEEFVAERTIVVDLRETIAVTVLITRDCRAVQCPTSVDPPSATSCVGGACADPVCTAADCSPVECMSAGDCPVTDACATVGCESGVCFARYDDTRCMGGEICDPDRGCVAFGTDASMPDTGPVDTGPPDAGSPDADLVLWLRFEDTPDDGVDDSSPNRLTAACNDGCPTRERGRIGDAYRFDGVSYLTVSDPLLDIAGPFTVSAWVMPDVIDEGDTVVAKIVGTSTSNTYKIWILDSGETSWETSSGAAGDIVIPFTYLSGDWVHLAGVWDGAEKALYINGVEAVRGPEPSSRFDDGPVIIGADINGGTPLGLFTGLIDDVRVYRRALTDIELADLASAP